MGQRKQNRSRGGNKSEGAASASTNCKVHSARRHGRAQTGSEGDASHQQSNKVDVFWHSLSVQERSDVLSISLDEFWAKLLNISEDGTVAAAQEGMQRLLETGIWTCYRWKNQAPLDSESFRLQVREKHVGRSLQTYLPKAGAGRQSSKYQQQLHKRMSALAKQNQQSKLANPWPDEQQLAQLPHWKKPIMTHLTNDIFGAMLREHRSLYKATITPVIKHIQRVLPETQRFSSLFDENFQVALEHRDLDLLPHAEVQKIDYWLEELVEDFGKAARESVGEAVSGNLQPLQVSLEKTRLTVNSEWLQHLQEAMAPGYGSIDGQPTPLKKAHNGGGRKAAHKPKAQGGGDPALWWLLGGASKQQLTPGLPRLTVAQAFEQLEAALQETSDWYGKIERVQDLISGIEKHRCLQSRVPYTEARRAACPKTANLDEIHVIAQQLLQEAHLAHCRKNHASYKCRNAQQRILHLLDEARQIVAAQDNMTVRLEAVEELLPSSIQAVPMRVQLVGLGIFSEVQQMYFTLEVHKMAIQENEQARDKAGDEEEQFQLEHGRWQPWADTTTAAYQALAAAAKELTRRNKALVDSSKASMIAEGIPEVLVHSMPGAFVPKDEGLEAQEESLRCMESFRDNLWPKLMTDKDEAKVYRALQAELEDLEGLVSEGRAALPLLEGQLMRAACDDPGPVIMDQVVLPLLQQRLTAQAEAVNASGQKPQASSSGLSPVELLLAEEEQQAAKKASGKKRASTAKKKQASRLPSSNGTSSQEAASTTLDPSCLQDSPAAAADSATSARGRAPAPSLQQRLGAAASANMAIARESGLIPPTPTGFPPEIVQANQRDQSFVRATIEEIYMAAEAAAESPVESPAGQPVDSPRQLTGFPPEIVHAHQHDQLFVRAAIEEFYTAAESASRPSDSTCHQAGFPETVEPQQRDELFVRAAIEELRAIAAAGAESPAESPDGQPADSACHQTGFPPEILHAQQRDQKFVKLAIEEFAAAAEASSSPAGHPADSPRQLTGLMTTTAAAYAPASLADGTTKRVSLLQTQAGPEPTASLSPLESDLSVCAFYPDDFAIGCKSEAEAAAMLQQPGAIAWQDEKGDGGLVAADPTAALLNFQALLHHSLRCPLSGRVLLEAAVVSNGYVYNGWIIRPWLDRYSTSPHTGEPLHNQALVPAILTRCLVYQQMLV